MATPFQDLVNTELPKRPYYSGAVEDWVPGNKVVAVGPGIGFTTVPDTGDVCNSKLGSFDGCLSGAG